jgi:hypothetical protein
VEDWGASNRNESGYLLGREIGAKLGFCGVKAAAAIREYLFLQCSIGGVSGGLRIPLLARDPSGGVFGAHTMGGSGEILGGSVSGGCSRWGTGRRFCVEPDALPLSREV